ncbi:unnamed protein product, partial [Polarella glacialis]
EEREAGNANKRGQQEEREAGNAKTRGQQEEREAGNAKKRGEQDQEAKEVVRGVEATMSMTESAATGTGRAVLGTATRRCVTAREAMVIMAAGRTRAPRGIGTRLGTERLLLTANS